MSPLITLEGITYSSRRSLVESVLPGLINQGMSANSALDYFKDLGYGIKRQDFLSLYRDIKGEEISATRIGNVRQEFIPSDNVFSQSKYDFTDKYRVVVSGYFLDPDTGDLSPFHYAQDRNSLTTIQEMQDEIQEDFESQYSGLAGSIVSLRVTRGYISPRYS